MADPIRIVGHQNKDGTTNEGLQAQVETDGALRINILDKYKCSDLNESGDPKYYGFIDTDGSWYIIEYNVGSGTLRYCKGSSNYSLAWSNRATQTYNYYHIIF